MVFSCTQLSRKEKENSRLMRCLIGRNCRHQQEVLPFLFLLARQVAMCEKEPEKGIGTV